MAAPQGLTADNVQIPDGEPETTLQRFICAQIRSKTGLSPARAKSDTAGLHASDRPRFACGRDAGSPDRPGTPKLRITPLDQSNNQVFDRKLTQAMIVRSWFFSRDEDASDYHPQTRSPTMPGNFHVSGSLFWSLFGCRPQVLN